MLHSMEHCAGLPEYAVISGASVRSHASAEAPRYVGALITEPRRLPCGSSRHAVD